MPRRRSKDPTTDIRITIPRSVLDAIHDEIEPTASRSRWISNACRDKLLADGTNVADATNIQLLTVLFNREVISEKLYWVLREIDDPGHPKEPESNSFSNPSSNPLLP